MTWNWQHFVNLADGVKLSTIMALIFANVALGLAVSFYTRTFQLKQVGDFLYKRVLPYVLAYFAVVAVAMADDTWKPAVVAVWGIILASLLGAIYQNLQELGLPLPNIPGSPPTPTKTDETPPSPPLKK